MYSFAPIDPAPYWGTLIFLLTVVSVIWIFVGVIEEQDPPFVIVLWALTCAGTIGLFLVIKELPAPPLNTPVTATLLESDYVLTEKSGKHSTSDNRYLMYMTPDGPVSFRRYDGKVYPKQAILYKN